MGLFILAGGLAACDLLDPTHVSNPDVTERDFLNSSKPMTSWMHGMERQTAVAMATLIVPAEIASDNYVNSYSFYNQFMDRLVLDYTDRDVEKGLLEISKLREMAEFGLAVVAERDAATTDAQRAELLFYKAVAHVYTGEWFHSAPADSAGPARGSDDHFRMAVGALESALELKEDAGYHILLARAYRSLGDRANAVLEAEAALAIDSDYLRFARFDRVNGPSNIVQEALYDRGTYDDLQPLARLDYLDPKFFINAAPGPGDDESSDLAYVKAEEAHLIIAEALVAAGDVANARSELSKLLSLVKSRKVVQLVDAFENRTQRAPGTRPIGAAWRVAFSEGELSKAGLVVERTEAVDVSVISGTCITQSEIDAVSSVSGALRTIYLLRQEIFIAEGRRMNDLGIQWPVPLAEVLNNVNLVEGPATQGKVPAFLPPGIEFDQFVAIDFETKRAVLKHDLNKILIENRTAPEVLPFF